MISASEMLESVDLAAMPREMPQFGRSTWSLARRRISETAASHESEYEGIYVPELGTSASKRSGCRARDGNGCSRTQRIVRDELPPVLPYGIAAPKKTACGDLGKWVRRNRLAARSGQCEEEAECADLGIEGWSCECVTWWQILPKGKTLALHDKAGELLTRPRIENAAPGDDCTSPHVQGRYTYPVRNVGKDWLRGCKCLCYKKGIMPSPKLPDDMCVYEGRLPFPEGNKSGASLSNWEAFPTPELLTALSFGWSPFGGA